MLPDGVKALRTAFETVTFDCYGTLIDWESGIREAFRDAVRRPGQGTISVNKLVELYDEMEREVEREKPYKSYREVQAQAVKAVALKANCNIPNPGILSEALPKWKPFPDTNPALERLAKHYKVGILSNVDNDLLASTLTHFTVPFEIIITAEQVKSYKPNPAHFKAAGKLIGINHWLHVAGSLYHDIEPATKLGVQTIWVNRNNSKRGESIINPALKKVSDLTELADWLKV